MLDRRTVIGGSYNFTASAQRRNVEDVTFVDSPDLAERFRTEWMSRQAVSLPAALQSLVSVEPPPLSGARGYAGAANSQARLAANEAAPSAAGAASTTMNCPADRVVWVNTRSRVYHFAGDRYFGSTQQGKYACQRDADAEGDRPSQGR